MTVADCLAELLKFGVLRRMMPAPFPPFRIRLSVFVNDCGANLLRTGIERSDRVPLLLQFEPDPQITSPWIIDPIFPLSTGDGQVAFPVAIVPLQNCEQFGYIALRFAGAARDPADAIVLTVPEPGALQINESDGGVAACFRVDPEAF